MSAPLTPPTCLLDRQISEAKRARHTRHRHTQKKRRINKYRQQMLAWMPALFTHEHPIPLKIGIREDILARTDCPLTQKELSRFLANWCRQELYLAAVLAGKERQGLPADG